MNARCADRIRFARGGALLAVMLGLCAPAVAAQRTPEVTNGGYMQTRTAGGTVVPLPLKHTDVVAEIAGVASSVRVTQKFHNPYKQPIEAVYVFPLPHRAAVHALSIRVGDRLIQGKIKKKAEARKIYDRAKRRGKTAALLEQQRPNIFTQSVANILPGETIAVQLRYVETLVPEDGRYAFVFPMVVGPRYMGGEPLGTRTGGGWSADTTRVPDASKISPPLLQKGLRPGHDISLRLRIDGGVPLTDLQVVTHKAKITSKGAIATIALDPADSIPNKDFVVRYRLTGRTPEAAVLAHRSKAGGGHLLLMLQPQAKMKQHDVAPREYVFVVDNSGSMSGFPLQQAREVVRRCLEDLRPSETFQIIKFAGYTDRLAPRPLPATSANVQTGIAYVTQMRGGGGTEYLPALRAALQAPKPADRARIVLFVTDGYVGYEREVLRFLRENAGRANVFALGVGSSVNRFLIDGMARIGGAAPFYLQSSEQPAPLVKRIFATIARPALTGISLSWEGLQVTDVTPAAIPDLFGEKPVVVAARYARGGAGAVTIRGRLAGRPFEKKVSVRIPERPGGNRAVAHFWARQQIADWMDIYYTEPARKQQAEQRVTALALGYQLMSRFTSFVAVDRKIRNPGGAPHTLDVPLPLPAGVSSKAAPSHAYAQVASISPARIKPGDPEIRIRAPRDARSVTAVFSFGVTKTARYEPELDLWTLRFLVPRDTPDGTYPVKILVVTEDGRHLRYNVSYTVDTAAPTMKLTVEGALVPGGELTFTARQQISERELAQAPGYAPARGRRMRRLYARFMVDGREATLRLPGGKLLKMQQERPGVWTATWKVPTDLAPGAHSVELVTVDVAGNRSRLSRALTAR